jgi:hypothetical protein
MDRLALCTQFWIAAGATLLGACASEVVDNDDVEDSVGVQLEPLRTVSFSSFEDPAVGAAEGEGEIRRLITSAAQYQRLLGHAAPSDVDFSAGEIVVFYSAGVKNSGGYEASIASIESRGGRLIVTTRLESPGEGCAATLGLTHPYVLVKLQRPRNLRRARFERDDTVRECTASRFCGGIAAIPCPGGGMCVDSPGDGCNPDNGGADCGGRCECNALGLCTTGFVWDGSPSVCGCVPVTLTLR